MTVTGFPLPRRRDAVGLDNVVRVGIRRAWLADLYHLLLDTTWRWLLAMIFGAYLLINTVFAGLYLLGGDCIENARAGSFHDAFFFSVQTMATIGYGKMVPRTTYANALVAFEALVGMVGMAMATGMMFARFARPTARVLFSMPAVIVPRDGVESFMFRMANARGNQIVEANVRVVLTRRETTPEGESVRRFHDLTLARSQNAAFAMSWTVLHPVTHASPLYGATRESLLADDTLIIVSVVGLDGTSGQTVHARYSYTGDDIRWGERLVDIMSILPDGRRRVDYTRFHDTQLQEPARTRREAVEPATHA